jgi:mRNA-degrading endonuclease RelE of RelBE toxin-antitoxin system
MDAFEIIATAHFERELKKLARTQAEVVDEFETILPILRSDPHNRTRKHPIRKLEAVKAGEGQYRIRVKRFRFRYDIEGRTVLLKACSLRRENTY